MSRYRQYRRSKNSNYAARRHIQEANDFSSSVGGTDLDVKHYFFNLSESKLDLIFSLYGKNHGASAEGYARYAYPKWKKGKTKMSGLVAQRLFALLPPLMPISDKLTLIESLWKHTQPRSQHTLQINKESEPSDIKAKVREHFEGVLSIHSIPDHFQRRFQWLAGKDASLQQQLENHFLKMQGQLSLSTADRIIDTYLRELQSSGNEFSGSHEIAVGEHKLTLMFKRKEVDFFDQYGCLILVVGAILFILKIIFSD